MESFAAVDACLAGPLLHAEVGVHHAFGLGLVVADILQAFDAHVSDFQVKSAGLAGHVNAWPPFQAEVLARLIAVRSRRGVGTVGISLERAVRRRPVLNTCAAQIHPRLTNP
ncbi:hypothetical protein D9M69_616470 [compost metagenome]